MFSPAEIASCHNVNYVIMLFLLTEEKQSKLEVTKVESCYGLVCQGKF